MTSFPSVTSLHHSRHHVHQVELPVRNDKEEVQFNALDRRLPSRHEICGPVVSIQLPVQIGVLRLARLHQQVQILRDRVLIWMMLLNSPPVDERSTQIICTEVAKYPRE